MRATSNRTLEAAAGGVSSPFGGKVYSPKQLAELWGLSEQTIRRLFQDEPGVFTMGSANPRATRSYITLRIPEAVAERVWRARVTG